MLPCRSFVCPDLETVPSWREQEAVALCSSVTIHRSVRARFDYGRLPKFEELQTARLGISEIKMLRDAMAAMRAREGQVFACRRHLDETA